MTNISATVPQVYSGMPLVDEGLARYFKEAWRFPILSAKEEYTLACRWRENEDKEAAHRLVTSHLRLVAKMAVKYRGYGLPIADLVAEGNIGLMKAVKKFDPERGFRLSTYAMWWIKASISEYILRSWSLVRLGTLASQKKLFFSLRRLKRKMGIDNDSQEMDDADVQKIAHAVDMKADVVKAFSNRLMARDYSLNTKIGEKSGNVDEVLEFQDTLVDTRVDVEMAFAEREELSLRQQTLSAAMDKLPAREQDIIKRRYLADDPETLEEIGVQMGISRERVRQLETRALDKIKDQMLAIA